ncbi:hypothetical protein H9Q72_013473 [Fusarium xylarioides]|uniref:methylisocitrate lyase n=1 Tax=Fusarium xylarioides TaxID=221167 RepID=A0A9P7HF37_9HYPO|nr:hypothetical protein H9Q70_012718 [Fusarium xylarioides]KAG5758397.1 hypothetical protein H9Q72_013473 [Fusarium xylarioides]
MLTGTARDIAALRNTVDATPSFSSTQAVKLWNQLREHRKNGTTELTFGTTDPTVVSQMAKTQQTVHADYLWDTVPKVVSKIVKSQLWHDQRQRQFRLRHPKETRNELENWDYLAPIVADGDMGFGSLTSTIKMAKEFVDAGAAMIHIDDLAIGMKKFTVGQGRTIVPFSEYIDRLRTVQFITSAIHERDHEYVVGATVAIEPLKNYLYKAQAQGKDLMSAREEWKSKACLKTYDGAVKAAASESEFSAYMASVRKTKFCSLFSRRQIAADTANQDVIFDWELPRSAMGQYMFQSCVKAIVERAIETAPLGDMTWSRMDTQVWDDIVEFHTEVRKVFPDRMFAFGYTGQYDYEAGGFLAEQVKSLHKDLARLGVCWQVQPIWSLQGLNTEAEKFSKLWAEEAIAGYIRDIQTPALYRKPMVDGFEKLEWCGGYLADAFFETVAGQPITK